LSWRGAQILGSGSIQVIKLPFTDRREAGHLLGRCLAESGFDFKENAIVLGLARGGVPVAAEVASELRLPLDVVVVRKLGVPENKELAMGAVAGGRIQVLDQQLIAALRITASEVEKVAAEAVEAVNRRERYYRAERAAPDLQNLAVILVDDGLATGSSMLAAVHYVNSFRPKMVIATAPVGTEHACSRLKPFTGACFCLATPEEFLAVGQWYEDFGQVSDDDVRQILEQYYRRAGIPVTRGRMAGN
jgi:putative phosphoribosyl transferase